MKPEKLKYWLAFSQMPEIGATRFKKLISYFADLEMAWQADLGELLKTGIERKIATAIIMARREINPDLEIEKLQKEKVKAITILEDDYPKALAEIYTPPGLFYYKGSIDILDNPCLSVVGTRKITEYGKRVTANIVSELASQGLTIVSGLAFGIDALAHQATLDADGKTAAVLGSGIDDESIFPTANRSLAKKIIETDGCLISEYPLGMPALKHHFPVRNRIISGLSLGTLIVEAGEKSGALITAKYTLDQNRQVFAIPGSIYSQSSFGTNNLIKMGAVPVTSADDILEALNIEAVQQHQEVKKIIPQTKEEEVIFKTLSFEPISIDKIVLKTKLDIQVVNSTLTMMEMKGIIRNLGGQKYVLN